MHSSINQSMHPHFYLFTYRLLIDTHSISLSVIAMMVYSKEESADVIIEQLSRDRDPILRYGGMYAIGLAYCGTGSVHLSLYVDLSLSSCL